MAWKVPLADVIISETDLAEIVDTYRSGWLSMGPRTEAFEAAVAEYTGAEHVLACANGTAALHLATLGAGLGPGDEVIVPSLTFVASANAIAYTGARPVFAEIAGLDRPWLTAETIERALTEHTRGVMLVHYGGHGGDTEAIAELCRAKGITLLEDAAHALGSRLGGRHLGTFGHAGAYSLFSNKNLAVGEGGMVVTDDAELAERMRRLRSHGMTTLSWDRHRGHASTYDVVALGFNYRIDEPRAALATSRLARLDAENAQRARLVERYREALADTSLQVGLPEQAGLDSAHHLLVGVLPDGTDRAEFRSALTTGGVQTSVHYPPVHSFSIYSADAPALPITDAYGARTVTLPLFAHMTDDQLALVIASVRAALPRSG